MADFTVTFGVKSGSARVYPDWQPFNSNYSVLEEGQEMEVPIVEGTPEALPQDLKSLIELLKHLSTRFNAAAIGANDDAESRTQVDGIVYVRNNNPVPIQVVAYNEYNVLNWEDNPDESTVFELAPGETLQREIVHVNALTMKVRKLVLPK